MHWSVGMLLHAVCVLFSRSKRFLLRMNWALPGYFWSQLLVLLILDDIPLIHFSIDHPAST